MSVTEWLIKLYLDRSVLLQKWQKLFFTIGTPPPKKTPPHTSKTKEKEKKPIKTDRRTEAQRSSVIHSFCAE